MKRLVFASLLALTGCATVPPSPTPVYRATGTEPFWSLTLDGRKMVFTEANRPGERVVVRQPKGIIGFAGEIYRTPRMGVNIVHTRCSDGMSDRSYPDKVQLRVDDRAFEGCGSAELH
jgi:heat shock protein HslJ